MSDAWKGEGVGAEISLRKRLSKLVRVKQLCKARIKLFLLARHPLKMYVYLIILSERGFQCDGLSSKSSLCHKVAAVCPRHTKMLNIRDSFSDK